MISNLVVSYIRTAVPIAVGALLTWLASTLHIVIDPNSQAGLVTLTGGVLTAAYYALARLLERKVPQLGVLLGIPAKPMYALAAMASPTGYLDADGDTSPPAEVAETAPRRHAPPQPGPSKES